LVIWIKEALDGECDRGGANRALLRRYNKLCGNLRSLIHRISLLPAEDPYRQQKEMEMLNKLYDMGILGQ